MPFPERQEACYIISHLSFWFMLHSEGLELYTHYLTVEKEMQPTPVSLPGKSHGQRSLECYSPWGHKELDMTERLTHTQLKE